MKIAYFTHSIIPSAYADSVQSMNMCSALAELGHDVIMYIPDRAPPVPIHEEWFSYYNMKPTFQIIKLPWVLIRDRSYYFSWKVVAAARRHGFDLYYSRTPMEAMLSVFLKLPTVYEAHAPLNGRLISRLFRLAAHRSCLKRVVTISNALADHYRQTFGLPEDLLCVARDATRIPEFGMPTNHALRIRPGRIHVGYTGALFEDKGIDLVVKLAGIHTDMDFHVVGGTPSEVAYWQSRAVSENIMFYGMMPPSAMPPVLACFDIVLAPYKQNPAVRKGYHDITPWMSPMKLFEYMAAGRAIVCSDLPVLREFLRHQENALLCSPDQLQEWSQFLNRLAESRELRQRLGEKAKADVLEHYTWTKRAACAIAGL